MMRIFVGHHWPGCGRRRLAVVLSLGAAVLIAVAVVGLGVVQPPDRLARIEGDPPPEIVSGTGLLPVPVQPSPQSADIATAARPWMAAPPTEIIHPEPRPEPRPRREAWYQRLFGAGGTPASGSFEVHGRLGGSSSR